MYLSSLFSSIRIVVRLTIRRQLERVLGRFSVPNRTGEKLALNFERRGRGDGVKKKRQKMIKNRHAYRLLESGGC